LREEYIGAAGSQKKLRQLAERSLPDFLIYARATLRLFEKIPMVDAVQTINMLCDVGAPQLDVLAGLSKKEEFSHGFFKRYLEEIEAFARFVDGITPEERNV
jgi:hypothetical protein